jgi:hypothetical protein
LPLISGGAESAKLAADLLEHGLFPANAAVDANHLAAATCEAMDYLLTWNHRQREKYFVGISVRWLFNG